MQRAKCALETRLAPAANSFSPVSRCADYGEGAEMIFTVTFARIIKIPWKAAKRRLLKGFPLRKLLQLQYLRLFHANASPGSFAWLALREDKYGGLIVDVPIDKRSPHAPEGYYSGLTAGGGDRMVYRGYGPVYERLLKPHAGAGKPPVVLMEIGILYGNGLAIWSDLFPSGRIIGLDIDLNNTENNMENLLARGAFANGRPELYEFDQWKEGNDRFFKGLLGESVVDICIDDASHDPQATVSTFRTLQPYLSESFVYFIEDCDSPMLAAIRRLQSELPPDCRVEFHGLLTVIFRRRGSV